jgi:hypothetical protein
MGLVIPDVFIELEQHRFIEDSLQVLDELADVP